MAQEDGQPVNQVNGENTAETGSILQDEPKSRWERLRNGAGEGFSRAVNFAKKNMPSVGLSTIGNAFTVVFAPVVGAANIIKSSSRSVIETLKFPEPDFSVDLAAMNDVAVGDDRGKKVLKKYENYRYLNTTKVSNCELKGNNLQYKTSSGEYKQAVITKLSKKDHYGNDLYKVTLADDGSAKHFGVSKRDNKDYNFVIAVTSAGNVVTHDKIEDVKIESSGTISPYLFKQKDESKNPPKTQWFRTLVMLPFNLAGMLAGFACSIAGGTLSALGGAVNSLANRVTSNLDGQIAQGDRSRLLLGSRNVLGAALGFVGSGLKTTGAFVDGAGRLTQVGLAAVPRAVNSVFNGNWSVKNSEDFVIAKEAIKKAFFYAEENITKEGKLVVKVVNDTNKRTNDFKNSFDKKQKSDGIDNNQRQSNDGKMGAESVNNSENSRGKADQVKSERVKVKEDDQKLDPARQKLDQSVLRGMSGVGVDSSQEIGERADSQPLQQRQQQIQTAGR